MKKCKFYYLDPAEGVFDCECIVEGYDYLEVSSIQKGYKRFVDIKINDNIKLLIEGEYQGTLIKRLEDEETDNKNEVLDEKI